MQTVGFLQRYIGYTALAVVNGVKSDKTKDYLTQCTVSGFIVCIIRSNVLNKLPLKKEKATLLEKKRGDIPLGNN